MIHFPTRWGASPAGAAACLVASLAIPARGAPPAPAAGPSIAKDASDGQFLDDFFRRQMHELDIPGALVVWVRGGAVRHAAAYGLANRETKSPVDYETTEFRLASVSKFFTAVCVLQLAEQGKIALDADVNEYLDGMRVGSPGLGTVTPARLLVHTGGLDERMLGYLARDPAEVAELGPYLQRWMPPQTRPAGVLSSYSNHGYALLGYLVERQSGMRFDAYARQHVFTPLGMERTVYLVPPLPQGINHNLCVGYRASGEAVDVLWTRPYPAGAMATTGRDMARFLVAFLAAARGEPSQTFAPSVVARLLTRHFSHRPDIPGYTLGLAEMELFGQRVLLKGGAAPGHSAVIAFFPEHDAGLFVALNRQEPQLWTRLLPELVERQFSRVDKPRSAAPPQRSLERFAGEYRATRYAAASFERILSTAAHVEVAALGGKLLVRGGINLECDPTAEPLVFSADPGRYVAFHEDDRGRIDRMYLNVDGDHMVAERVGWLERNRVVAIEFLLAFGVPLAAGLIAAIAIVWRRLRRGESGRPAGAWLPLAHIGLAAAIVLTLGAAFFAAIPVTRILYGPSPALWAALTGANLIAICALVVVAADLGRLVERATPLSRRVASLIVCAAGLVLIAFLIQFNLIGYRL